MMRRVTLTLSLATISWLLACASAGQQQAMKDPQRLETIAKMKSLAGRFGVVCQHCHVDLQTYARNHEGEIADMMMHSPDFAGPDFLAGNAGADCSDCHVAGGQFSELTEEGRLTSAMTDIQAALDAWRSSGER